MSQITATYEKGLACHVVHGLSGVMLMTDAPPDNNGLGRSFSPTDLVATALGTCMMTIMGIVAERSGIDLSGSTIWVTKEMALAPARRIGKLTVVFNLVGVSSSENRARLEMAARKCPVHHSLHPDVTCELTFNWMATNSDGD